MTAWLTGPVQGKVGWQAIVANRDGIIWFSKVYETKSMARQAANYRWDGLTLVWRKR